MAFTDVSLLAHGGHSRCICGRKESCIHYLYLEHHPPCLIWCKPGSTRAPCPAPQCQSATLGVKDTESPNLGAIYSCGQSKPLNIPSFLLLSTKPNLSLQDIPVTQRRVKQVTPRPSFLF